VADKKRSRSKADKAIETSVEDAATDATDPSAPGPTPETTRESATQDKPEPSSDAEHPEPETNSPAEDTEPDAATDASSDHVDAHPEPEAENSESSAPEQAEDEAEEVPAEQPVDRTEQPPAPVQPEQVVVRKGGFLAMFLGGVAAAAIGFGMARYVLPQDFPFPAAGGTSAAIDDLTQRLEAQSQDLSQLSNRIDAVSESGDTGGMTAEMDSLSAAIDTVSGRVDEIATRLDAFEARLSDVEASGPAQTGDAQDALSGYAQELQALQASIAEQKAEIETLAQEARAKEESAVETAQATMRRAALTRIQTALDAGTPFEAALADLEAAGVAAPEALASAAVDGVPTQAGLAERFPDAARRALAVSRSAGAEAGAGGLGGFLRSQLGARSLEPREGSDPDAVLSRAEAAVRDGRLNDALAEIETLPEGGRAELSDWSADAARRLDALAAAEALAQDLN